MWGKHIAAEQKKKLSNLSEWLLKLLFLQLMPPKVKNINSVLIH